MEQVEHLIIYYYIMIYGCCRLFYFVDDAESKSMR